MIQRSRFLVVLAVFISSLMIFARLGQLPLRDPDEGRNSEVAREMQRSGAWLVPTYDGLAYLESPPFILKRSRSRSRSLGARRLQPGFLPPFQDLRCWRCSLR